ncbi:15942_t:CDS:1 [Rhizophagus irregularis]|nr:15942_t:CDS:1 [Rhizophagus irregularis]
MIINLACRFSEHVGKDLSDFVISIDNTNHVETLREMIFNEGGSKNRFYDLDSSDLILLKVHNCNVHSEVISKIILQTQEIGCTCVEQLDTTHLLSNYWNEQPSEKKPHVVVEVPFFALKQKNLEMFIPNANKTLTSYILEYDIKNKT